MMLVVVVPTLNEVGNLARLADELRALRLTGIALRILIVDDASTDGTATLADVLARGAPDAIDVLHRRSKRGLGSSYLDGFARAVAAGADLVAQMDADLSHQPAVLPAMIDMIAEADLVIGSRFAPGGGIDRQWPWYRKLLSWSANRVIVPALLSLPVTDATSGYRLWRRDALVRIAPSANVRASAYGFQVEMAHAAHRAGCRIAEVPIYFRERDSGESKLTVRVGVRTAREIWAIRRQRVGTAARAPANETANRSVGEPRSRG
jgi:dolichol-phosphate mannosyltransferase